MSRSSFQGKDEKVSMLADHQKRRNRGWESIKSNTSIDFTGFAPSVVYECTADLVIEHISANALELVGIHPERIVGKQLLSEERILASDSTRLRERITRLTPFDSVSMVHAISNDEGLPVWVAHSVRKLESGCEAAIVGWLIPLNGDLLSTKVDASVISQFVHKIGNHFQLINLLMGSLKRSATTVEELGALQETIDKAVEFTRSFSNFTQAAVCATAVDIGEVVGLASSSIASGCAEKNVFLRGGESLPALKGRFVHGDAFLLELAFQAIFHNALEATHSGQQILVSALTNSRPATNRPQVKIVVADTGDGIDADMLAKVADPFVTSKRDRDGLGLSTAVRIFEIHGGALKISSAHGQGTQVEILLPLIDRS